MLFLEMNINLIPIFYKIITYTKQQKQPQTNTWKKKKKKIYLSKNLAEVNQEY